MENKSNNTEKILANKLSLDHFAPHAPELKARVMMAVSRRARRWATLHTIRNVALGVVVAVAVLALVGGAMVLAMRFLGLEALVQQMDSYINEALTILRTLAQTATFGLVTLVVTLVGGVMIFTQWQAGRIDERSTLHK